MRMNNAISLFSNQGSLTSNWWRYECLLPSRNSGWGREYQGHAVGSSHLAHILAMAPVLLWGGRGGPPFNIQHRSLHFVPETGGIIHTGAVWAYFKIPITMDCICLNLNRKFGWKKAVAIVAWKSCFLCHPLEFMTTEAVLLKASFLPPYPILSPLLLQSLALGWERQITF